MEICRGSTRILLLTLVLALVMACGDSAPGGSGGQPGTGRVEGSVLYRERMMLPPDAQLEVQLQDISRPDAMAAVMASVMLNPEGGPPYDFAIEYDPSRIDSRMRYGLRATISVGEQLLFTSTEYIDPFAGNPVEVLVRRVPEPVRRDGPALEETAWVLQTLQGEAAPAGAGGKPLDLQLLAGEDLRAAGFSGCNRYSGSYSREGGASHGNALAFGPLASTMMACAEGEELERSYLQVLGRVDAYRLDGEILSLLSGGEVLATFQPR